jgi:hypothetical protein
MRERASAKPSIRTKGQITKVMRTALRKGGKLELDTGKSDAEIEREDKAIVLSDDVVEEMKRMLYNWQVYNTREDVAQLDENDRGGPPVEIVEVDEDRQVIKKEAPSGARKTWEDFRCCSPPPFPPPPPSPPCLIHLVRPQKPRTNPPRPHVWA